MKCQICKHGETQPGTATITLERNGAVLVFKDVPSLICENCGEAFADETITRELLLQANNAVKTGALFDVRTYHAA